MKKSLLFLFLLAGLGFSCEEQQLQSERDRDTILNYIEENNLDAEEHPSGLFYIVDEEQSGDEFPSTRSRVAVKYKGYFTDGTVFDESPGNNTVEFNLDGGVITGWTIGIPLIKKGGTGTLIIPSALGYGFFGSGGVPPNTVIIFDVELVNFSG